VDVRDVAQGILKARDKGRNGQIYILSGHLVDVATLWQLVQELGTLPGRMITIPARLAQFAAWFAEKYFIFFHKKPSLTKYSIETLHSNASISNEKARSELGYSPRSLRETMSDTVRWWQSYPPMGSKRSSQQA